MYRIRFHGRGGQGMKTSSRILGTAFFLEGYDVQDAPKYGAERRGAPMSAYVRADKKSIFERGIIYNPDLIVIADESLLAAIPETLAEGEDSRCVMLINSSGNVSEWKEKYNVKSEIAYLPEGILKKESNNPVYLISTACAAASAALTGVISWSNLEKAVLEEHPDLTESAVIENIKIAEYAYEETEKSGRRISEASDERLTGIINPEWVSIEFQHSGISAPAIHNTGNSISNETGSWRTLHPEVREDLCSRCSLCSVYCPDNAVKIIGDGFPVIDYAHCKGCLICASICPKHAISAPAENSPFKRSHYRGGL